MKKMFFSLTAVALLAVSCNQGYEVVTPDFDVTTRNSVCKVGSPVVFDIKGNADMISFYSGEFGHDYKYRDRERLTPATMNMSFDIKETCSGDAQLLNPAVVPISFSGDFKGEYTENCMNEATWTDVTSRFTFPPEDYRIPVKNGSVTVMNKVVDINDLFGESRDSIFLRFNYYVKAYNGTDKIGRTTVQISNFSIDGHTQFADIPVYSIKDIKWGFVPTASWAGASDKCSLPGAQASLTFNCEWNPSADRQIYAVAGPIYKAKDVNSGVEPSIPIKSLQDPALTSYSYSFNKPGEYEVVFVARNTNVYGKEEVVRRLNVKVLQDGGTLDDPEEGEWKFSAGPNEFTKVGWNLSDGVSVSWQDNDKVAVFGYAGTEELGAGCPYRIEKISEDGHGCTFVPADASNIVRFLQDTTVNFYSYYPYTEGQNNPHAVKCAIPRVQSQTEAGSTDHLSSACFFRAEPKTVKTSDGKGQVEFLYKNLNPVLELSVKLSAASSIAVPVKQITVRSGAGVAMSSNAATADITLPECPVALSEPAPDVQLKMNPSCTLPKNSSTKFYFIIAPGSHDAGDLQVEVTAIDNSVATVRIADAVSFLPGKVYRKSIEITSSDFVPADPFAIRQGSINGKAGVPVTFDFSGNTSVIQLFSGDKGHDIAFRNTDRLERAKEMKLSFTMRGDPSGSANAFNPAYAALGYSVDFNGTMSESAVNDAVWTDISSNFTLPTVIKTDTPSGSYDIAPLFPADKDDIYIRFDYQFNAGTSEVGRTIIYVKQFDVVASYPALPDITPYSLLTTTWNALLPSTNVGGAKVNLPGSNIQFTAGSWKPSGHGQAWVIAKLSACKFNLGKDTALNVKSYEDEMPASYQYTYTAAGSYNAVFEITTESIFGTKIETVTIPVTIEE